MTGSALIASPFPGLTVGDLLLLELPHVPEERREDVAWNFTGYPCWWAMKDGEWHPNQTFQRQLREFREQGARTND